MKIQRHHSVGLVVLSSALALFSSSVHAYSSTSLGCIPGFFSDGDCDLVNNNKNCGYDGGDCCECTCVSGEEYTCGDGRNGGFSCIDPSAPCVDDDDVTVLPTTETFTDDRTTTSLDPCTPRFFSDGDCDRINNNEECGYDGGDCCECTCVSTDEYTCGDEDTGGFACVDPLAPCVDDDDVTMLADDTYYPFDDDRFFSNSFEFQPCIDDFISDGDCDFTNNQEKCDYDGGDCCECDCVSTDDFTCGVNGFDCIDPNSSCVTNYVEVGTMTTVGVSANAYDTRPGQASGQNGCMEDGCAPALTRDGDSDDAESRWSCSQSIVESGTVCYIEFSFQDIQDIVDVQVAFWKNTSRSRTLEVLVNGAFVGQFDSSPTSTFTSFGIDATDVHTIKLATVGLAETEWISLTEVLFRVEA